MIPEVVVIKVLSVLTIGEELLSDSYTSGICFGGPVMAEILAEVGMGENIW